MNVRWSIAFAIAVLGCNAPTAPEPLGDRLSVWVPSASDVLADALVGMTEYTATCLVLDTVKWRAVWENVTGWQDPPPPLPTVDFETSMVVVAVSASADARLDSVVTYALGSAAYVSECPAYHGPYAVSDWAFQLVQVPRTVPIRIRTRRASTC